MKTEYICESYVEKSWIHTFPLPEDGPFTIQEFLDYIGYTQDKENIETIQVIKQSWEYTCWPDIVRVLSGTLNENLPIPTIEEAIKDTKHIPLLFWKFWITFFQNLTEWINKNVPWEPYFYQRETTIDQLDQSLEAGYPPVVTYSAWPVKHKNDYRPHYALYLGSVYKKEGWNHNTLIYNTYDRKMQLIPHQQFIERFNLDEKYNTWVIMRTAIIHSPQERNETI